MVEVMKFEGSMNENAKETGGQFVKLQNNKLIGSTKNVLTDAEIVVYGYIALSSYNFKEKRTLYKGSVHRLALAVSIKDVAVKESLAGLVKKKMLKKLKAGYEIAGARLKGNYVMMIREFLLSTQLTTTQKAFLLRVDALRREGLIQENSISNGNLGVLLNMNKTAVRNALTRLDGKDYLVEWIRKDGKDVVLDYDLLKESVRKELTEEVVESREKLERIQVSSQLLRYGRIDITKRRKELLDRVDALYSDGEITLTKAKVIYSYVKQGRLKLVEDTLNNLENE